MDSEESKGEKVRRIVVFDSGWGGELVADYLMHELGVVEVIRVIDWAQKIYGRSELNIDAVITCLKPYIGNVDLIVLGGYNIGTALQTLRSAFPEQKFIAPRINYDKLLGARHYPERVAILMNERLRRTRMFQELREKLPYTTFILPNYANWEDLIDNNLMTREVVQMELAWDFEVKTQRGDQKTKVEKKRKSEFSALEFLAEQSPERRALMKAIQNFGLAAERADAEETQAAREAKIAQEKNLRETARERMKPDLVLILNTHFWEIKPEIERILGWQVRVLDFRETLLRDVCSALKLRGVDGKRPK